MNIKPGDKGRRILVTENGGMRVREWKIVDVSPQGRVKVRDEAAFETWKAQSEFRIVEWLDGPPDITSRTLDLGASDE
jgi:hypothetical protein